MQTNSARAIRILLDEEWKSSLQEVKEDMRIKGLALKLLVALWLSAPLLATAGGARELTLLNWSDYMDPDLVARFERQFGAKVIQTYFETDLDRDNMLVGSEGQGYDLAVVDGPSLATYRRRGWLSPLDESRLPHLDHIDPRWTDAFEAEGYAVPYFWGTMGIAYRTDLVTTPITRWRQLLEPEQALRGKIVMINDQRDTPAAALAALGYSVNSTSPYELGEAEALLLAQKPHVKRYGYIGVDEDSALVSGHAAAAMVYNGDALALKEHHESIRYVLPEEGSLLWIDYLVVLNGSPNKDLALEFINFLNEPAHAAQLAQSVYFATPNRAAKKLLPVEFLNDPVIYPSAPQLERSTMLRKLEPRQMKRYACMLANVTR